MSADPQNSGTDRQNLDLTVDETLLAAYDGPVPRHVAVIMDGNGRWANQRGMRRIRGHHEGANAVRRTVESCRYLGVEALTLYAFSSQNWSRPLDEVSGLMTLFDLYIKKERKRLLNNGIALRVIGDRSKLSDKLQRAVAKLEDESAHNTGMTLQVAVSYGGREEIVRACQQLAEDVSAGRLEPAEITAEHVESYLYTRGLPDPDLVIRTSGELRVSNFLLWQIAYSELFVTDVLWPDFAEADLLRAFESFGGRERRFGLTGEQASSDQGN
jgi:undecaprenyl diphosphate synthase